MSDEYIKVFRPRSREYNALVYFVNKLNQENKGPAFYVGETWFDQGQGWRWTTILRHSSQFGVVQVLNPVQQMQIIDGVASLWDKLASELLGSI